MINRGYATFKESFAGGPWPLNDNWNCSLYNDNGKLQLHKWREMMSSMSCFLMLFPLYLSYPRSIVKWCTTRQIMFACFVTKWFWFQNEHSIKVSVCVHAWLRKVVALCHHHTSTCNWFLLMWLHGSLFQGYGLSAIDMQNLSETQDYHLPVSENYSSKIDFQFLKYLIFILGDP